MHLGCFLCLQRVQSYQNPRSQAAQILKHQRNARPWSTCLIKNKQTNKTPPVTTMLSFPVHTTMLSLQNFRFLWCLMKSRVQACHKIGLEKARRKVLDGLCKWLLSTQERVTEMAGQGSVSSMEAVFSICINSCQYSPQPDRTGTREFQVLP